MDRAFGKSIVQRANHSGCLASCNNGELSSLDNYVCQVFDREFSIIRERGEEVKLEYDYHLLKRWLLKMSYNSARMSSSDAALFQPLLPYIMGKNQSIGRSVKLFLEMTYPSELTEEDAHDGVPMTVRPAINRVGFVGYKTPAGMKIVRAVHLRSFSFLLAFLPVAACQHKRLCSQTSAFSARII